MGPSSALYDNAFVGLICILQSNQILICGNSGNAAWHDSAFISVLILILSYSDSTMFCDSFYQFFYPRFFTKKVALGVFFILRER